MIGDVKAQREAVSKSSRFGAFATIEAGKLKGRKLIIPRLVYVEKGSLGNGSEYSLACLKHEKFIPVNGCDECEAEEKAKKIE